MADWQEQLNTILSDPDAMAQIASIAQSLGGGAAAEPKPDGASPPPPPPGMDAAQLEFTIETSGRAVLHVDFAELPGYTHHRMNYV
ncbi:MAG: hypothetical protein IJQ98_08575, partial [Oscillospiraceae bacterium]|nr:hypothetical protein [Oscillospiraceae bacterium]